MNGSRTKRIQYGIHAYGFTVSRVGSKATWPTPDRHGLVMIPFRPRAGKAWWAQVTWTSDLPIAEKNRHRRFWGIPELNPVDSQAST